MLKNKIIKPKSLNEGIEILRFLLCLWVVTLHCSGFKHEHKKYLDKCFHVPTFFLLSFYFYYKTASKRIIIKIISRFQRLLYPYIIWSIIVFINNNYLVKNTLIGKYKQKLSPKDLYIQILTGSRYYQVFWFQFNLIFLSICITINSFIFKKYFLQSCQILGVIFLYLYLSQINRNYYLNYSITIQTSLGRLTELVPLAIIGCHFSSINLLSKIKNLTWIHRFILLIIIYFLFEYNIFITYPGFGYPEVFLHTTISTMFLIFFGSLDLDTITIIKVIIKHATKYTGGIYYIHLIYPRYIKYFVKTEKNYFLSFKIYFICYIICFIGSNLFKNNNLKYLFI